MGGAALIFPHQHVSHRHPEPTAVAVGVGGCHGRKRDVRRKVAVTHRLREKNTSKCEQAAKFKIIETRRKNYKWVKTTSAQWCRQFQSLNTDARTVPESRHLVVAALWRHPPTE